jgi:RimJ/RimL family protein N-acetyltransferase
VARQALLVPMMGRLVALEPLAPRHEADLARASGDPEVWQWMWFRGEHPSESFHRWLQWTTSDLDPEPRAPFAVIDRATGHAIGSTGFLAIKPEHRRVEIGGTWYPRSAWGSGANVEAKFLMLEHAFDRLGYRRVEFKTDARNARSRAALEALPAQLEGVFRKHMVLVRGDERRDSAYYSIVDDDWPHVRENLDRRLRQRLGGRSGLGRS